MEDRKSIIQSQIEEIQRLNDEKNNRPLTLDELKQVFISMGNTDEDWNSLLLKANEFNELGNSHLTRNNHSEALEAFESATKLNPYQHGAWGKMAECQYQLYNFSQDKKHIPLIELYVDKALAIDPKDMYALNTSAGINRALHSRKKTDKAKIKNWIKVAIFFIIPSCIYFIGFGGIGIFGSNSSSSAYTKSEEEKIIDGASDELAKRWTPIAFQINPVSQALNNIESDSTWNESEEYEFEVLVISEPTVDFNVYTPMLVEDTHNWYSEIFEFVSSKPELFSQNELKAFNDLKTKINSKGEAYNEQVRIYNRTRNLVEKPGSYPEYPLYEFMP